MCNIIRKRQLNMDRGSAATPSRRRGLERGAKALDRRHPSIAHLWLAWAAAWMTIPL